MKSVFNIKKNSDSHLIANPKIVYKEGDQITCSRFELFGRIHELFGKFGDFDWTNVVFAGGLLSALVQKSYNKNHHMKSDLDLFISSKKDFHRVFEYFKSKFDKMYSFGYENTNVVTIVTCEYERPIQLIGLFDKNMNKKYPDIMSLIRDFDFTSCQIAFDGENCVFTDEYIEFCNSHIAKITSDIVQGYRIIKTIDKGYGLYKPDRNVAIVNLNMEDYDVVGAKKPHPGSVMYGKLSWNIRDLNIDELRNNKCVKNKLNKFYMPPAFPLSENQHIEKILNVYVGAKIIINNDLRVDHSIFTN